MNFQGTLLFVVVIITVEVPSIVTGRPQLGVWLGKSSENEPPNKISKPGESTGGITVITEKPEFTGLIQLQVFLVKENSHELVKIHESNSSFSLKDSNIGTRSKCNDDQLLYEKDGKCYVKGAVTVGIDTPCGNDFMRFVERDDKPGYGKCTCLRFKGSTTRPVVHWMQDDRCYWLYDQGPCQKGEWLVYGTESRDSKNLKCSKRTCPENTEQDTNTLFPKFWFEHNGKCYKTESHDREFCNGNDEQGIHFALEKPEPVCLNRRPVPNDIKGLASGVNNLKCKAGQKPLLNGECGRTASFE